MKNKDLEIIKDALILILYNQINVPNHRLTKKMMKRLTEDEEENE